MNSSTPRSNFAPRTGFVFSLALLCLIASTFASDSSIAKRQRSTATKKQVGLILTNGKIFSADERGTIYEAVAIDGNRIIHVGTSGEVSDKFSASHVVDLKGKLVTPGFNDAHIHFLSGGVSLLRVNLIGAGSLEEARRRIKQKVAETPKGAWVLGRGWDHTLWGGRFPSKKDLDDIAPDNPVFLQRVDGHVSWANSLALQKANVTRVTKAPEGGEIELDAQGEPTGILKETASGLVSRVVPETSAEEQRRGLERALSDARSYGLTSVQDNSGYEATKLYRDFMREGKLTVRVAAWQNFEDTIAKLKAQRAEFATFKDDPLRIRLTALKGYVDGTLGSRTAAMLAPFSDDHNNAGIPRRSPEELTKMIVERDAAGFQVALHAIGDRANQMALNGFQTAANKRYEEYIKTVNSSAPNSSASQRETTRLFAITRRHRIEHAQVVAPNDFRRFSVHDLGVVASMQPTHAISDKRWAGERLGEYRVLGAYAWHMMRSYGVHVPFGTDFPVEPMNPYLGLFAAVTRRAPNDRSEDAGWQPQERLSIEDAIRCYTAESAYASFEETEKGQVRTGMLADLVVHSRDLLTINPQQILQTEAVMTVFDGKVVYERGK